MPRRRAARLAVAEAPGFDHDIARRWRRLARNAGQRGLELGAPFRLEVARKRPAGFGQDLADLALGFAGPAVRGFRHLVLGALAVPVHRRDGCGARALADALLCGGDPVRGGGLGLPQPRRVGGKGFGRKRRRRDDETGGESETAHADAPKWSGRLGNLFLPRPFR